MVKKSNTPKYKNAIVKNNNGNGSLLCNQCHDIIKEGFEHEDKIHYCHKCGSRKYFYKDEL